MKYSFFIILLTILALNSFAQVQQEWVRTYNNSSGRYEILYDMFVSNDAVVLTGEVENVSTLNDFCTVKYSFNGDLLWAKYYNSPANNMDIAIRVLVDGNNNVIVGGRSNGGASSKMDLLVIKYSSVGTELWQNRYDGTLHDWDDLFDMAIDARGNIYVTGYTTIFNSGGNYLTDCITIKYSGNGTQEWVRTYNSPNNTNDYGTKIVCDRDQSIYIAGYSSQNLVLLKYNLNGDLDWERNYLDSQIVSFGTSSISLDSNRNIIISGICGYNGTLDDFITVKYDKFGNKKWSTKNSSPGNQHDRPISNIIDPSGNIYLTGTAGVTSSSDFMTVKLDSNGLTKWIKYYNNPFGSDDNAYGISLDNNNNVYVTGSSSLQPVFGRVMTSIKYDSEGNVLWKINFDSTTSNITEGGSKIKTMSNGDIFISGSYLSYITTGDYDYLLLKYSQPIGIQPISSVIPQHFSLHQNYPNPFNPSTKIKFEIPLNVETTRRVVYLNVFDILGREVRAVVNENLKPGIYEVDFNASELPSGVYFYKLTAGDFVDTKKMIILK